MRVALLLTGVLLLAGCSSPSPDPDPAKPPVTPAPPATPVDADHDGVLASADCADNDATRSTLVEAFRDADGDFIGDGDPQQVCIGSSLPPGWVGVGGDCAPADATRFWSKPLFQDADGDGRTTSEAQLVCVGSRLPEGYFGEQAGEDCNDYDASRWRTVELYFDVDADGVGAGSVEQACIGLTVPSYLVALGGDCAPYDSQRHTLLSYAFRDVDGDGVTVPELGEVCSTFALPQGYSGSAWGLDCNDANPALWSMQPGFPDADGDGAGAGASTEVCAGNSLPQGYARTGDDCAEQDPQRWEQLAYQLHDADGDGRTVPLAEPVSFCVGSTDPQGYARSTSFPDDCDDAEATRWQLLAYAHRDADGDGATVPATGSLCSGASLPAGYSTLPKGADCDDADAQRFVQLTGYPDVDADGVGAGEAQAFCTAGTLPAGQVASSSDCAAQDAARWRTVTPGFLDRDGDGYTVADPAPAPQCIGTAPDAPSVLAARGNDCEDSDPAHYLWRVLYPDADGDGVGAAPRALRCLGTGALPAGESLYGWDSDDADPAVQQSADDEAVLQLLVES